VLTCIVWPIYWNQIDSELWFFIYIYIYQICTLTVAPHVSISPIKIVCNWWLQIWTHFILMTSKEYIPCHTIKKHPRVTKDIKKSMKIWDKFYQRCQRTKTQLVYEPYNRLKIKTVNIKIIQAKSNQKDKLVTRLETLHNFTKQYWSIAKQLYGQDNN